LELHEDEDEDKDEEEEEEEDERRRDPACTWRYSCVLFPLELLH